MFGIWGLGFRNWVWGLVVGFWGLGRKLGVEGLGLGARFGVFALRS